MPDMEEEVTELGDGDDSNGSTENLLYDVLLYDEWLQDSDNKIKVQKEKKDVSLYAHGLSAAKYITGSFLKRVGYPLESYSSCSLPQELIWLISSQLPWKIAVSSEGREVAVVQDRCIEIRSIRDDYGSVIGRCSISHDRYLQWRSVAWSLDGTMIAISDFMGNVDVFDVVGTKICTILSTTHSVNMPVDLSQALCGLFFTHFQHSGEPVAQIQELILVNYQGNLTSFLITQDSGYQKRYSFQFENLYPYGVSCAVYHPSCKYIIVGGTVQTAKDSEVKVANDCGITAWRPLDIAPYWKLVSDYEEVGEKRRRQGMMSIMNKFRLNLWSLKKKDGVYKLCLSLGGRVLVCLHQSGKLSLWDFPSMKLRKMWEEKNQPDIEQHNPNIIENMQRRKAIKELNLSPRLIDVGWWSDELMILSRCNGGLSVSSIKNMKNMLGKSPEWLEPSPQITNTNNGGFLGLECELAFSGLEPQFKSEYMADQDLEAEYGIVQRTTSYVKEIIYYVTDIERFSPPRKKANVLNHTYRLFGLISTTPEELYARKIDAKEYGEALMLAKAYHLDCDLVYQRQWREESPVSVASIQDYLSKIGKRSWVLHECLERVPEGLDAMRELLQYGLMGTDLKALLDIGKGTDHGKFILCDTPFYDDIEELDDIEDQELRLASTKRKRELHQKELLSQVNFACLTLEQRELCRARTKLLHYLDRLSTYEMILGGPYIAEEQYDHIVFQTLRKQNIVEAAIKFARASDWKAVDCIFTYHGEDVLPHRLAILSNFPETLPPEEYSALLPEMSTRVDDPDVQPWQTEDWRDRDWCEEEFCKSVIDPNPMDLASFFYDENPHLLQFRGMNLNKNDISLWYVNRAVEVEQVSHQVEYGIDLLKLAMERGVEGLENSYNDFLTMEALVFEGYIDDDVNFEALREMNNSEKLALLMAQSSEEMFEKNVWRWMVPFLSRCEQADPGSAANLRRQYLLNLAVDDLTYVLKIFSNSKADLKNRVITDDAELMVLALECVYICERNDQLHLAQKMHQCLPQAGSGRMDPERLRIQQKIVELEKHIQAAEILEKNKLPNSLKFIQKAQDDFEETKNMMTRLARCAGRRSPPPTESEWTDVQMDMLELCQNVFKCVQPKICQEIFVDSLLCSGSEEFIMLAGKMFEKSQEESSGKLPSVVLFPKVTYIRAVELVLSASREYFNSSTSGSDIYMDLAKHCLLLIDDFNPQIHEELDLIRAINMLEDCSVKILPLQVRLSKDRLNLVQQAIDAKFSMYFNQEKLLKLGHLLRIPADNASYRDGMILQLVAKAAIKNTNLKIVHEVCQKLIESGFPPIWTECKQLAEEIEFKNVKAKIDLLSFAVTHCTANMIEPILRARSLLETQILYDKLSCKMNVDTDDGGNLSSPAGTHLQTKQLLSSSTSETRTMISAISSKKWWTDTLHRLSGINNSNAETDKTCDSNTAMECLGCHPFYSELFENPYISKDSIYDRTRQKKNTKEEMNVILLRTAKLEETLTDNRNSNPASEVLLQLSSETIPQDTALGFAYLLAFSEINDVEKIWSALPCSQLTLELSTYFYALQGLKVMKSTRDTCWNQLYGHNPQDVISVMLKNGQKKLQPENSFLFTLCSKYYNLLNDFKEAQFLKNLGKGVDTARFAIDQKYKEDTINGLAMTHEDEVYKFATVLAEKNELPMWEFFMCHLEYLFAESGLATPLIEKRIHTLEILPQLKSQTQIFWERMNSYVYPAISGTDLKRFVLYYTLLLDVGEDKERIKPDAHVKLLKKLMTVASGLDYKKLTNGEVDPLVVLKESVTGGNVNGIAKFVKNIPDCNGQPLNPSSVYALWAQRFFWEGDQQQKTRSGTLAEWIHRYESCADLLQKLLPQDMILFVDGITFTDAARDLTDDCRAEILRRAIKYSRQGGKRKKLDDKGCTLKWEDAAEHFNQSLTHLQRLRHDTIVAMRYANDPVIKGYADKFDSSRSEPDKVRRLLLSMVMDGQSPDVIQDVLDVAPVQNWTAATAVLEALKNVISAIREPEIGKDILENKTAIEAFRNIVSSISNYIKSGGDCISQEEVLVLMRPFCADKSLSMTPRLDILASLEKAFDLAEDDTALLVFYKTEAIVHHCLSSKVVTKDDVKTDAGRKVLFDQLLNETQGCEQLKSLTDLLHVQPVLSSINSRNPTDNPWSILLTKLINLYPDSSTFVVDKVKFLQVSRTLSSDCVLHLFKKLVDEKSIDAVKIVLNAGHKDLYKYANEQLNSHTEVQENSGEFLDLILKLELTADIISSIYYGELFDHLLTKQLHSGESDDQICVNEVAKQLNAAGYQSESGSLLLSKVGSHCSFNTYDSCLGIFSRSNIFR